MVVHQQQQEHQHQQQAVRMVTQVGAIPSPDHMWWIKNNSFTRRNCVEIGRNKTIADTATNASMHMARRISAKSNDTQSIRLKYAAHIKRREVALTVSAALSATWGKTICRATQSRCCHLVCLKISNCPVRPPLLRAASPPLCFHPISPNSLVVLFICNQYALLLPLPPSLRINSLKYIMSLWICRPNKCTFYIQNVKKIKTY